MPSAETGELPELTASPGPAGGGGFAANLWDIDRKFGEAVAPNGGPLELAVDDDGLPGPFPMASLITVMFDAGVVMDPDGPYLARDDLGELLPVVDGQVVDADGEPVIEIAGHPVEIVERVALDGEGGALLDGDSWPTRVRSVPFSASQIEFIRRGGAEGQAYGDLDRQQWRGFRCPGSVTCSPTPTSLPSSTTSGRSPRRLPAPTTSTPPPTEEARRDR